MAKKIAIIGAGNIGQAIYELIRNDRIWVPFLADSNPNLNPNVEQIDATNPDDLLKFLKGKDAVISSAPFFCNKLIADIAYKQGIPYFDLTEDVDTTKYIQNLTKQDAKGNILMPQCGLAPGAVGIIANGIAKTFDTVKSIEMRVGALPQFASNQMKYYLSWSTSGLVNEYCNLCEMIWDGKKAFGIPLEGVEDIIIDGVQYEAFNTSGGCGTLPDSWAGKVEILNYKTIRYPGHRAMMSFLMNDLNLNKNRAMLEELFNQAVPITSQDVVVLYISVTGYKNGSLTQHTYVKKIYPEGGLSAIQLSTASGVLANVELFFDGKLKSSDQFLSQEIVGMEEFFNTKFGSVYRD